MARFANFILAALLFGFGLEAEAAPIDFNKQIRPILSDRCFLCHGPDADNRKAGLRLDVRDEALKKTDSGRQAIHPEKPMESEIIRRILSTDPDEVMPPPSAKLTVTDDEKAVLQQWISEGAPYAKHWAFQPIVKAKLPEVKQDAQVETPVDRFIQSKLEEHELALLPEATRERLIRRVTFDITGLPPTLDEIDRFVRDTSPDAYEKWVDRLLRRETYGERMAAEWMDVARYSDSYGYQVDRDRFVWPWRDWVIQAFNENRPYDQFVTEQLAGDLLPNATNDQILATTFNRLHSQKVEGGSVEEEFRIEYVSDRTHTFGTAFLGLTLECSRCHDHKYDPLSQREYYQLTSFFANIDEAGLYSYFTGSIPTPTLRLTSQEENVELAELESAVSLAEAKSAAAKVPLDKEMLTGPIAHFTFDERADGKFPNLVDEKTPADSSKRNVSEPGHQGRAVKLTGDDPVNLKLGNFTRSDPFTIALWMNTPDVKERAVVLHRSRAWTDAASRGYQLLLENGLLSWSLIHYWPGNAIRVRMLEPLATNRWKAVTVSYDGSSRADGLKIYVDGKEAVVEIVQDSLTKNITGGGGDHITLGERFRDNGFKDGLIDELRVYDRELAAYEVARLAGFKAEAPSDGPAPDLLAQLHESRKALNTFADGLKEIMVMKETPTPRTSYRLARGAYDARAEPVSLDTPKTLPPMPSEGPRNRLGLAQWLTAPEHPLTARVTVNRYWQMIFGRGLVSTPEDFGSQGKPPTHPELLDWLASDFMKNGWDVKRLMKTLVMSGVYRQQSLVPADAMAMDPENLLLSRAPRFRMPAEMIRDNALFTSGLLVDKIGGEPVKPYEVSVSFKPVKHAEGQGLYRRSLYTYWKRTSPAPVMIALDAVKRDVCMVKRDTTSTPLQAFIFMNDPQFVEAARVLAERVGNDLSAMFRSLTSRTPSAKELKVLESMLADQLEHFKKHTDQAKKFLETGERKLDEKTQVPELAALTVVANALMSYDECVMKR